MKQLFLFLCIVSAGITTSATIIRVNNNPGINANFNSAQSAHNAANNGDTIHLETSLISYGSVTATKQLVWMGNGYFVDPTRAATLDAISFNVGSANSVVMGLYVSSHIFVSTNNISVSRCNIYIIYLDAMVANRSHDFSLTQSMVTSSIQTSYSSSPLASSNYTFTNNVINGTLNLPPVFSSIILIHNFIYSLNSNTVAFVVNNNIINGSNGNPLICTYSINVYNNLFMNFSNSNYVGSNGNIYTASNPTSSSNTTFISSVTSSSDLWLTLKSLSPAIGAGLGGVDIGPLGGSAPYKFSGIPSIPTFSQFQFQSTPVNSLPVIISTRSNN